MSEYMVEDLWLALGLPLLELKDYRERNGTAGTWANLCGAVRDRFRPKCGVMVDGEHCVLAAPIPGGSHVHHGASDVGRSDPLPWPTS